MKKKAGKASIVCRLTPSVLVAGAPNMALHRIAATLRILLKLKGRVVAARGARER